MLRCQLLVPVDLVTTIVLREFSAVEKWIIGSGNWRVNAPIHGPKVGSNTEEFSLEPVSSVTPG